MAGISGKVAQSTRLGFEDAREQRQLAEEIARREAQRRLDNATRERELGMRDREAAFRESDAAERRADRDATRAEREAERARRLDTEAATRRTLANMAGIVEMTGAGLDPDAARREIAMTGLRGGVTPPQIIEGLIPIAKDPKRHVVTTPGPGGRPLRKLVTEDELSHGVEEYREPKAPRQPARGFSQRDIVASMRQARRDAISAYRAAAGPTGRVTDETGTVVPLDDFVDEFVDSYMADIETLLSSEDAAEETPARAPSVRLRPRAGASTPGAPTAPTGAPQPPGARPVVRLRRREAAPPSSQRPQVGDVVTLRDGTRVRVTGFDASGKVQGARVP